MSKDILRLAAILLVICGIAAACVGTAHDQTAPLIEARKADAVREGYKQVLPDAGQLTDEPAAGKHIVAVKRSETDGQTNGYIYTVNPDGYSGKVVIMLGIESRTPDQGSEPLCLHWWSYPGRCRCRSKRYTRRCLQRNGYLGKRKCTFFRTWRCTDPLDRR